MKLKILPYPNIFSKYFYYFTSLIVLLKGIYHPIEIIKIFLFRETHQRKTVHLRNGIKFIIRTKMDLWIIKETILDRCYEKDFIKIEDGGNVIDIGASIGDFSIIMAREYPKARIIAFEPHPEAYELAVRNIHLNNINSIVVRNDAVSSKDHRQELNFTSDNLCESTSLYEVPDGPKKSNLHMVNFISLQGIVGDLKDVELLKMDCEGGEYDILLNSPPETIKKIKNLAIEWHDGIVTNTHEDLCVYLKKCGFKVRVFDNPVHANIGLLFATR